MKIKETFDHAFPIKLFPPGDIKKGVFIGKFVTDDNNEYKVNIGGLSELTVKPDFLNELIKIKSRSITFNSSVLNMGNQGTNINLDTTYVYMEKMGKNSFFKEVK